MICYYYWLSWTCRFIWGLLYQKKTRLHFYFPSVSLSCCQSCVSEVVPKSRMENLLTPLVFCWGLQSTFLSSQMRSSKKAIRALTSMTSSGEKILFCRGAFRNYTLWKDLWICVYISGNAVSLLQVLILLKIQMLWVHFSLVSCFGMLY